MGHNNEIGKDNQLLWYIPSDLKHFKQTTKDKTVVMGRKTYESIGKPLADRTNLVLSRVANDNILGCFQIDNIQDVLNYHTDYSQDIYIIGGQSVYEQFLPYADELIITHVDAEYNDADSFFPDIDYGEWEAEVKKENYEIEPYYTIIRYKRVYK